MDIKHLKVEFAVVIFSGFLQKIKDYGCDSGMIAIAEDAHALTYKYPECRVFIFPWKANINDVAEMIWRRRPLNPDTTQKYVILGYSYGGQAAINFANEIERRSQTEILNLGLCDPVRRWPLLPGVAAAFGLGSLKAPDTAKEVWQYVQRNPRWSFRWLPFEPAGHSVYWKNKKINPIVTSESHTQIDNNSQFRMTVRGVIERQICTRIRKGV